MALALSVEPAAAQPAVPTAEDVAAIRALVQSGRAREAQDKLKPFDSGAPIVSYLRGLALYHTDQHPQAIDTLTPLVARFDPGTLERREIEQVLGLALYGAGRLKEAVPYLEATRRWAGDNVELNYYLGLARLQVGPIEAARAPLAVAFGVPAESAAAHLVTAQMLIRLNLADAAESELKRALTKDARLPQVHFLLGQLALFRGRLAESLEWTRKELDINPGNAMAWYQLGDIRVRGAEWDEAITTLQRSLWINPFFSGPYILLGQAYMKTDQLATAESMLRRAVQYDPNNRSAHYLLAQVLQRRGQDVAAQAEFAIAEKLQDQPGR